MNTIIIAVGNGGGNVVDAFRKESPDIPGVEYLYLDDDHAQLESHGMGDERKAILERSCKNLGDNFAAKYDVAILVVCLGGTTENYYADAVAEELHGRCKKLLCIASLPFKFEGRIKRINAVAALGNIKMWCDMIATQDNVSESISCCEWATVKEIRAIWQCAYKKALSQYSQNGINTFHPNGQNKDEEAE